MTATRLAILLCCLLTAVPPAEARRRWHHRHHHQWVRDRATGVIIVKDKYRFVPVPDLEPIRDLKIPPELFKSKEPQ